MCVCICKSKGDIWIFKTVGYSFCFVRQQWRGFKISRPKKMIDHDRVFKNHTLLLNREKLKEKDYSCFLNSINTAKPLLHFFVLYIFKYIYIYIRYIYIYETMDFCSDKPIFLIDNPKRRIIRGGKKEKKNVRLRNMFIRVYLTIIII